MLEEAKKFVLSLPQSAMKKVLYNVHRVADGEQNAEFKIAQTSAIKMCPLVVLMQQADCLGHKKERFGDCHAWHRQEDAEDSFQGEGQGRENQTGVFQ